MKSHYHEGGRFAVMCFFIFLRKPFSFVWTALLINIILPLRLHFKDLMFRLVSNTLTVDEISP